MDFSKVRSITVRKLIVALRADGFELVRQRGSHRHFKHPDGRRVTVSAHHASDTFRIGNLEEHDRDPSLLERSGPPAPGSPPLTGSRPPAWAFLLPRPLP